MKIIMTILLTGTLISSLGQKFSISFDHTSVAYLGMDNRVSCTIEGLSDKQVVLTSDNGVFEKDDYGYIYKPGRMADSKIIVSKSVNGNLQKVGEYNIAVRQLPAGVATIGGLRSGSIAKGYLRAQPGVGCHHMQPPNVCLNYTVLSYTITVFRGDSLLFCKKQDSNLFTEEITQFFTTLQSKDKLLIYGISYRDNYGEIQKASPIELEIE